MAQQGRLKVTDITENMIWERIPLRRQDSHKGTFGKVLCVAGSSRFRGAAALCTEGALRSGCGIVTLATVEPVFASVQARMPEAILMSCRQSDDGSADQWYGGIHRSEADRLRAELDRDYAALVIGPGMGNTEDTAALVRRLVTDSTATAVLDADALNALTRRESRPERTQDRRNAADHRLYDRAAGAGLLQDRRNPNRPQDAGRLRDRSSGESYRSEGTHWDRVMTILPDGRMELDESYRDPGFGAGPGSGFPGGFHRRSGCAVGSRDRLTALPVPAGNRPVIITPHPGEMARLCNCTIADIKSAREEIAAVYAVTNNCVVVLKEHRTLIATPDGRLYRNTTGNSGLARGGSGDILAGMIGSLAAQGLSPEDAAICGVWLHGRAAELCSQKKSQTVMLPHDIFDALGQIMLEQGR